jgi:hypothetical protein
MRNLTISGSILLLAVTTALPAQRADAAATARRLMQSATAALASGDTLAAADSVVAAARAWPAQPAYWLAAARWQAQARRPAAALEALATLTTLGGHWRADDPRLAPLTSDPRFRALRPPPRELRSLVVASLPDPDFHPEGVAWDPRTQRLFVGSVHRGTVVMIDSTGVVHTFLPGGTAGLRAVFGVLVDTTRNVLWVSSADVPERAGGAATPRVPPAVYAFSLTTGALVRRVGFPDTLPHLIGELVLAPDGGVWGTDSESPTIYRVPDDPTRGELERAPFTHRDWVSLQGLAFSTDGQQAWLADWTTGLYHLNLARGRVTPVAAGPGMTLLGIDGLYRTGEGHFLAIQNGIASPRVIAIDLQRDGLAVRALRALDHPPGEGEPTLGTVTPQGLLFVSGSLWPFYDRSGTLTGGPERGVPAQVRLIPWH